MGHFLLKEPAREFDAGFQLRRLCPSNAAGARELRSGFPNQCGQRAMETKKLPRTVDASVGTAVADQYGQEFRIAEG